MTLTLWSATVLQAKVCVYSSDNCVDDSRRTEFKDDSHIIPRSSSVLVKRIFVRPGKGKAAMYIGTTGPISGPDSSKATGATSTPSSWQRGAGNISKRFDGKVEKEPTSTFPSIPVRPSVRHAVCKA